MRVILNLKRRLQGILGKLAGKRAGRLRQRRKLLIYQTSDLALLRAITDHVPLGACWENIPTKVCLYFVNILSANRPTYGIGSGHIAGFYHTSFHSKGLRAASEAYFDLCGTFRRGFSTEVSPDTVASALSYALNASTISCAT